MHSAIAKAAIFYRLLALRTSLRALSSNLSGMIGIGIVDSIILFWSVYGWSVLPMGSVGASSGDLRTGSANVSSYRLVEHSRSFKGIVSEMHHLESTRGCYLD